MEIAQRSRKNRLFSGIPEGAEANGFEPYGYLRHMFEKLPLAVWFATA